MEHGKQGDMITVQSSRFGELQVPENSLIEILGGIIGFPGLTRYVLLEYNPPFSWLQSLEKPDLAFVVVDGSEFGKSYAFSLPKNDQELGIEKEEDVAIVNLVSVRSDAAATTVNMKAPVIVNLANRRGRQLILDNPDFPVRMPLWNKQATETKNNPEKKK